MTTLHNDMITGTPPVTHESPVSCGVNAIAQVLFGAVIEAGIAAPTGPAMHGSPVGGASPFGPTNMLVAPMSAAISAGSSRNTGLAVSTSPCRIRIGMVLNFWMLKSPRDAK